LCACGCFLLAAIVAALAWCILHGLWWAVAGIVIVTGLIGWFARKTAVARKALMKIPK
jgi:hypothetical protein